MKVWTVILAGVLLAALPNLGSGVREDARVFVAKKYAKFERRVVPAKTYFACTTNYGEYPWFRIDLYEKLLLEFEKGNNTMNVAFSLGTPSILMAISPTSDPENARLCTYVPSAQQYQNTALLSNKKVATEKFPKNPIEYFAVKVRNTAQATLTTGWNRLKTVVKNQFPGIEPTQFYVLFVEKTAAGQVYVGAVQNPDDFVSG